jgi:hypothetical protein
VFGAVLLIWDVFLDSGPWVPVPIFIHPGSEIFHPGSASKNLSIFNYFNPKKWFLSFRKYDPGLFIPDPGSWIRILTFYPSLIPDPGVKKTPDL